MKALRASLILITGLLAALPALAQDERDVIEVIRTQIQADRQALVAQNMQLNPTESEEFWPLYREFQLERAEISDRRVNLIMEFRDNYSNLDDERAEELLKEGIKIQNDKVKLWKKYRRKIDRILPASKTLRFFQIESKLDTIIDFDLARSIPLAIMPKNDGSAAQ